MKTTIALAAAAAALGFAAPATAQSFYSTFENVPGGPGFGGYTTVDTADGWTSDTNGIELQNHAAGDPAANGGNVFVELDTNANSSMSRTLDAGLYSLSFLYSPRPNLNANSSGINVLLNGQSIYSIAQTGGSNTNWQNITLEPFRATAGSTLTFAAGGISDSLGGYIDNIRASAVPEPATWLTMILGFGMVGLGLRYRRRSTVAKTRLA